MIIFASETTLANAVKQRQSLETAHSHNLEFKNLLGAISFILFHDKNIEGYSEVLHDIKVINSFKDELISTLLIKI